MQKVGEFSSGQVESETSAYVSLICSIIQHMSMSIPSTSASACDGAHGHGGANWGPEGARGPPGKRRSGKICRNGMKQPGRGGPLGGEARGEPEPPTFTECTEMGRFVHSEKYDRIVPYKVKGHAGKISFNSPGGGRQPGGSHADMENGEVGKASVTSLRRSLEEEGGVGEKLVFSGYGSVPPGRGEAEQRTEAQGQQTEKTEAAGLGEGGKKPLQGPTVPEALVTR